MCGLPLSTLNLCLRCAFLSRLRCVLVGTQCSTSQPPRPARVTRAVRRASSALGRSGPSRRYQFLRLLLLLQFGVRFTPLPVCGPLLFTSSLPEMVRPSPLGCLVQDAQSTALSLRQTNSVKVLSWLLLGMSTSTTLARITTPSQRPLALMLELDVPP